MTLIYIAGYVGRNHDEILDTYFYYEICTNYLKDMNCGGLNFPCDITCQLTIYSYIIFHVVANLFRRSSCCNILIFINKMCDFDIKHHHGLILSNIMSKNYCNMYSPSSCQEPK